ncbi:hypothetical protein C3L33_14972, partial [Rhododendron williamsianum]
NHGRCHKGVVITDGAWDIKDMHSGIGWVLTEEVGELLEQQGRITLTSSAFHSECLACLVAMIWCFDHNFCHITVATDCSSPVDGKKAMEWQEQPVIRELCYLCDAISFVMVNRVVVQQAHVIG